MFTGQITSFTFKKDHFTLAATERYVWNRIGKIRIRIRKLEGVLRGSYKCASQR